MTRIIKPERIAALRLKCKTQQDIIVAYLWYVGDWTPTHALMQADTPFGFIGSAGHVRARELARNECSDRLKGKVEREEGRRLGLDPRFEYFRYWEKGLKAFCFTVDEERKKKNPPEEEISSSEHS